MAIYFKINSHNFKMFSTAENSNPYKIKGNKLHNK